MSEEQQPKVEEEKKTSETVQQAEEVDDKEAKQDPTAENEIRVAAKGQIKNYLGYAFRILNKTNHKSLKIRATGNAIVKANILIELVKRRVGDLHQLNSIYSMVIKSTETKNPLNVETEMRRRVTAMDTLLSKEPLDENDPGYQKPEPKEEPYHGSRQPRKKDRGEPKEDGGEKKQGGGGRKKGPKLYNNLPPADGKEEEKKDGKKKDEKKKEPAKKEKDKDEKKGRRTRKEKINSGVKDDEMEKGNKRGGKEGKGRREKGGRHMMHPGEMYGPRMVMGGPEGHRGYPVYMDRGRPRDPRAMPPYMGYPVRSYDDFNVRPNRGKGNRRGPPVDPRQGMYYPPYYDPYMMYPDYGNRRQYQGPPRYNDDGPPRNFNPGQGDQRDQRQQMYNEQPPRQRMPEKEMRRGGPPPMERRGGPPPEKMGDDQQKQPREFRPRDGDHRGGRGGYNDDRGEPREFRGRGGDRDFNGERGGRGGRGNREPRPFNPTEKPEGLDRSRFGEQIIRGNRGMRGSRGAFRGGRGGGEGRPDRDQEGDGQHQQRQHHNQERRRGEPFHPSGPRNERGDGGHQPPKHSVHQRPSRGGRGEGGAEAQN